MRTELDIIAEKNYARETGLAEGRAQGLEEGRAEGRAQGLEEGRAEGEVAKAKAIAKKLLAMGLPIEQVAEGTGLSMEKVKTLG